jgi:hypothetical protein
MRALRLPLARGRTALLLLELANAASFGCAKAEKAKAPVPPVEQKQPTHSTIERAEQLQELLTSRALWKPTVCSYESERAADGSRSVCWKLGGTKPQLVGYQ